jgi:hypothetical protein
MKVPDLQGHDTFRSKINPLNEFSFFPVKDIEMSTKVSFFDIFKIKTFSHTPNVSPFGTDHNIMIRLVPKIVSKRGNIFDLVIGIGTTNLEGFAINENETTFAIVIRTVGHTGNHDVSICQTMTSVWNGRSMFIEFLGFDDMFQFRFFWVSIYIHDVNPTAH